ncbi:overproduction-induced pheromone-resistant [Teratosphaeriaceae sp. CCFEE 6253]|nr:overproduction-induced pheromone-resistant [Teratosphaeriaceae sp. CCFEE 6253]
MGLSQRGTMSYEVERTLRSVFKRCLKCPDTTPTCPTCRHGEICSLVPADCDTCAFMTCIANPSSAPVSRGPNIGAIAGGVVGGIAAIAIIVFFVWRFWIKKRREQQELEAEEWEDDEIAQQKAVHSFSAMHTSGPDAASTRTRGSLANSILSRASNIIQIAYIPGVTNRNGNSPGRDSLLSAAPVPPIPAATRGSQPPKSPLSNEGDMLFFRPGDLRDSSYSGASSIRSGIRDTQYTRQSITPSLARSSVTSEIYRDEVTPSIPATSVARAAPRMVSIKSSHSDSTSDTEPTTSDTQDFTSPARSQGVQVLMPGEGPPSASSSTRGKAKQVTVGGAAAKGRFPVRQASDASTLTAASGKSRHAPVISSPLAEIEDTDEEDDDDHARARRSMHLISTSLSQAASRPRVQPAESPFFDASESPPRATRAANPYASMAANVGANDMPKRGGKGMGALSDIIEENMKHASRIPSHEGLGGKRDVSPFSDAHATD